MSKVTKIIEDMLTEWEERGIPQWKQDQLVRDCLVKFKETQWEKSVLAQNLTSLDKKDWNKAFNDRFPMHAPAVVEYDKKFKIGLDIPGNHCKGLAFENKEQVIRWMTVIEAELPKVHAIVNDILGVPAFSAVPAESGEAHEDVDDVPFQR